MVIFILGTTQLFCLSFAVALCLRSGIGTEVSSVSSPYAQQCYINMSKNCRSGRKFPWIRICHCSHLHMCDKNLDVPRPWVAEKKSECVARQI